MQTSIIDRGFNFGVDEVTGVPEVATFDSVISEQPSFDIAITDNPVATGVSMSDHAYAKPDKLVMEVAVTDSPMLSDGQGTPSYRLATTWTGNGQGNVRRSVNAWAYILSKAKAFAVFDVQIGLGLYRNMMFESGSAKQEKDSMGILRAAINLKQVTFALTSSVLYPPRGPKKTQRAAAPKTDGGRKESPETDKKKPVSVLAGLLGIKK